MQFEYLEPTSTDEAIGMLKAYADNAKILAGGTDLVVQMKQGSQKPKVVIHIGRIEVLEGIFQQAGGGLRIGALTTMRTLEKSPLLRGGYEVLREGAAQISCPQIRNVATLGGNSCNGIPSADSVPSLIALGAQCLVTGSRGDRKIPLECFHRRPGQTVLGTDELLRGFEIPPQPTCTGGSYLKYSPRGTSELSVVGVAALLTLDPKDGTCRQARIVLGACAPTPIRAKQAEAILLGNYLSDLLIIEAAEKAAEESSPNPGVSVRASAPYRREMVRVWTRYAIKIAHLKADLERKGCGKGGEEIV